MLNKSVIFVFNTVMINCFIHVVLIFMFVDKIALMANVQLLYI